MAYKNFDELVVLTSRGSTSEEKYLSLVLSAAAAK